MDIEKLEGRELDEAVAAEVMGWHWDDDWGCLIPPEQKAKPSEMWTEWKPVADRLFREPIDGAMVSGVSYNGDSSKIILPDYSTDIAAAMQVLLRLEEIDPNAIIRVSNGDGDSCDCDILADTFSKLQSAHVSIEDGTLKDAPLAICRAALMAVEAE